MNKTFYRILLVLLLVANIYWIFKLHIYAETNNLQNIQINHLKSSINSIQYYNELQYIVANHQIDMNADIVCEDGQFTQLNSLHNTNKELLVFKYGELNCKTCLNEYIDLLVEILPDSIIANKTIFIANNSNAQNLSHFKRISRLENTIFRFDGSLTPIDSLNIPYFFLLNEDGEIRLPYVPIITNDDLTIEYFKRVLQKLS